MHSSVTTGNRHTHTHTHTLIITHTQARTHVYTTKQNNHHKIKMTAASIQKKEYQNIQEVKLEQDSFKALRLRENHICFSLNYTSKYSS